MISAEDLAVRLGLPVRAASDSPQERVAPVINDVVIDSRSASDGALFCCVRGEQADGHDFAAAAVQQGASALLCSHPLPLPVPQLISEDVRRDMSRASAEVWGRPSSSLTVVGVTGTNGKTTVVSMITAIMNAAGRHSQMIGTLTGERTTPEAPDLQRKLSRFRDEGVEVVAIEVSSHALVQHRVADVDFDLAVFTNLGRDHLDFHKTEEAYFAAKALLFEPDLSERSVVNVDDVHGRLLADAANIPTIGVSRNDVDSVETSDEGTTFRWNGIRLSIPMIGLHNVDNAILAAASCRELGISDDQICAGLSGLPQVPGRFEMIPLPAQRNPGIADIRVIVDYAHTPDALTSALSAARELAGQRHRVVVVFGCGGDRDREKRPMMGAVAAALSDVTIVTSDNPRSENPLSIIDAIVDGFNHAENGRPKATELRVESDRRRAIADALDLARDGDVVVIAGKGHESGQTIAGRTEPFDDREVAASYLASGTDK